MKKTSLMVLLVLLFEACSVAKPPDDLPAISLTTPMVEQIELSATPRPIIPDQVDTPDTNSFQIIDLDPVDRVVSLSDLGLSPTTRILVFNSQDEQFLSVSKDSVQGIPNIHPTAKFHLESVKISPDYKRFAYLVIDNGFNIWVSSIDGLKYTEIQKNAVGPAYLWLNSDQFVVYNNMGSWMDCPSDLQIISLYQNSAKNISDMVPEGSSFCFPVPYFNPNFSKGIYLDNKEGWKMHDYSSENSERVLLSLDTSPDINKYFFHWGDSGLTFAIPAVDKITFGRNLVDADLLSSDLPLKIISLPPNTANKNATFDFWNPDEQLSGFDLVGTNGERIFACSVQQSFVIVDLLVQELRNYCLDRTSYMDQVGTVWSTYISADNRLVGWTVRELPSNIIPLGTVILNIKTGNITYLPGYELLGFGEVDQ
jgi:hypothetical protein